MPRLVKSTPKYRKHRSFGQAIVTLDGRYFYLGPHGTKTSRLEYDRLIGEWMQNGRRLSGALANDLIVNELAAAYWKFAIGYYRKHGKVTREAELIAESLRFVRPLYGKTSATDFGPTALKTVRSRMIEHGWSRKHINKNVQRLCRMFKWAAAEEMIHASVPQALSMVTGLRFGRTEAREIKPIMPVDDATVAATLPHLLEVVADMVRFQRLTGCRPAEVCSIRPRDLDTSGEVWKYRPESHKTEHYGRERVVFVGPKSQEILRPYLLRPSGSFCFSPQESEKRRRANQHEIRKTPMSCGNRPGTNRKRRPKRIPGENYDTNSYRRAIHRAVEKANRLRSAEAKENGIDNVELLEKWSPNRLRHAAATEIRSKFGLEAAQVALGHAAADVTQVYAERDHALAARVARENG